jgi:aryl-alcohol dehydrogenase-like predicted oxidoreductase
MERHTLRHSDIDINRLGFGLTPLTGFYGPIENVKPSDVVSKAVSMGIDFIDTNDSYGLGHAEKMLSSILKKQKQQVRWVTKFGLQDQKDGKLPIVNGRPDYVRQACEASLKRLQIDCIDLYYIHRVDPAVPIEDTVGAMSDLVAQGKIKAIGLCEASASTIKRAHSTHPVSAVQIEYSIMYREAAEQTLQITRELGISFVAYAPLGRGMLTGSFDTVEQVIDQKRKNHPRFHPDNFTQNRQLVKRLEDIARQKNCTAGQLALSWLLHQGPDIVPIPGTTSLSHLVENIDAGQIHLDLADLESLDREFPVGAFKGQRFPTEQMTRMNL